MYHGTLGKITPLEESHLFTVWLWGPPLEYSRGGGEFLEINIFVGKMGEINKSPQGMVEIQPILR